MDIRSFIKELKRRNIYKVAVVYAITGWVVIQIAEIAANSFGAPPWVMKMIITVILLGFPITLIVTWAFEVTPEGEIRAESSQSDSESETIQSNSQYFWVGTILVVAILFGGWWFFESNTNSDQINESTQKITDRSIAVLPLNSVSKNEGPLPLAEGLHDDLLTRLANVSDLQVISRTSVERYRNSNLALPAIADSLGVRWILEGGVQQMQNQVNINAQLIDPETDTHIWAKTYQRDLNAGDIFAIQGEIAREISSALQAQLTAGEQERIVGAPTEDLNAFQLYIQGRNLLDQRTSFDDIKQAGQKFVQAIEIDSTFAFAWTGLADAMAMGLSEVNNPLKSNRFENLTNKQAAQKALELKPNLSEAHSSMGIIYTNNHEGPKALKSFQRAVELKPSNAQAHNRLGRTYFVLGRPEKGLTHLELAEELNPQHWHARHALYDAYLVNGQIQKGLKEANEQQRRAPELTGPYFAEVRALTHLGRYEEAIEIAQNELSMLSDKSSERVEWETNVWKSYLVVLEAAVGDTSQAQERFNELQSKQIEPVFLALCQAALGNSDKVFESLNNVREWGWIETLTIRYSTHDSFSQIKNDPRFNDLIREVNEYWGLNPDGSIPEDIEQTSSL
ncbi:MAG: tetratricopeptide repeat protein [Balneolaceae bacterium]|nr:tetratricopeptide repeat protein [Balneolaceae bacterium]